MYAKCFVQFQAQRKRSVSVGLKILQTNTENLALWVKAMTLNVCLSSSKQGLQNPLTQ